MNFDFSAYPLHDKAYSGRPMTILDQEPKAMLSAITEVALIETGNRLAREHWQKVQLGNLIKHAVQRSAFWRKRIADNVSSNIELAFLPILTRHDLRKQVASEGSLLRPSDGIATGPHATSGSSGIPASFFISEFNARYNQIRSLAQYFLEGRDLSLNRTRMRASQTPVKNGFSVEMRKSWIGPLASLIKSGTHKHIDYFTLSRDDCRRLIDELKRDNIGYLACTPRLLDTLLSSFDLSFLKDAETEMWISFAEAIDPHLLNVFVGLGIPIQANYSSEEVGMIGSECSMFSGCYHVATTNVIVEVVDQLHDIDGIRRGKILVTHLHSYATPFIRYDLDDLGCLSNTCACGHDGPTVSSLQGRVSSVIKHRDGRLSPFHVHGKDLAALAGFTEYRMRQTAFDKIILELGGRSELNAGEVTAVAAFLKERAGPDIDIEVKACPAIDWGPSRKRPAFRCEI